MIRTSVPVVLLTFAAAITAETRRPGEVSLEPYSFETYDRRPHEAELGRLWVREDRTGSADRLIEITFVRLKSTAAKPGNPIVFLPGGPGIPGTAIGRVPVYFSLFEQLRAIGDVILLDQRGIGMSSPNTQCPSTAASPGDAFASESALVNAMAAAVRSCADHWRSRGVDLRNFTTRASADDLEELRVAVGAEKLNLVAHSYGTSLALAAMERHSDHIGRVVLAAPAMAEDNYHSPTVWDIGLRRLASAGGDRELYQRFRDAVQMLDREPLALSVQDRRTKQAVTINAGGIALQLAVRTMLPNGRRADRIPALIDSVARRDRFLLAAAVEELYNGFGSGFTAMQFAISCSDRPDAERRRVAERQVSTSAFGDLPFMHLRPEICSAFGSADAHHAAELKSTVPTLLLSGTLDTNAPPFQAEQILWGLPNGVHISVENGFHETLPAPEVQKIVVDFMSGVDVRGRKVHFPSPTFVSIEAAKAQPPGR